MELVAILALIALIAFAIDFGRQLPAAIAYTAFGLACLAGSWLVFIIKTTDAFR